MSEAKELAVQDRIVYDMDILEYHAHPAISNSGLGWIEKAPRYFQYAQQNADLEARKKHFVIGGAFHTLLLEPKLFEQCFHTLPDTYVNKDGEVKPFRCDARMQVYKDELIKAGDKDVLTSAEYFDVLSLAESVTADQAALKYIQKDGIAEASLFWTDEVYGVECRARPDYIIQEDDGDILVDFKSSANASKEDFERSIYTYGYDRQAYFYTKGYEAVTGRKVKKFVFIAVEKKEPYLVGVYPIDEVALMSGQMKTERLLDLYAECKRRNFWPGLNEGKETEISIPGWAAYKMEFDGVDDIKPSEDEFLAC